MKNKTLRMLCAFLIIGALSPPVVGQEGAPANFSMGADMVSRYVWRGINLGGSSPALQPFMEYSFGESGLTAGVWASYSVGLAMAGAEADLFVSYSPVDWLDITLTDYFFPSDQPFEMSKEVSFGNASLPVFSSLIFNPEAGNMYVVVGISF